METWHLWTGRVFGTRKDREPVSADALERLHRRWSNEDVERAHDELPDADTLAAMRLAATGETVVDRARKAGL